MNKRIQRIAMIGSFSLFFLAHAASAEVYLGQMKGNVSIQTGTESGTKLPKNGSAVGVQNGNTVTLGVTQVGQQSSSVASSASGNSKTSGSATKDNTYQITGTLSAQVDTAAKATYDYRIRWAAAGANGKYTDSGDATNTLDFKAVDGFTIELDARTFVQGNVGRLENNQVSVFLDRVNADGTLTRVWQDTLYETGNFTTPEMRYGGGTYRITVTAQAAAYANSSLPGTTSSKQGTASIGVSVTISGDPVL